MNPFLKLVDFKQELIADLRQILEQNNGPIDFGDNLVTIRDPQIDTDYENNEVTTNQVSIDAEGEVIAQGDIYDDGVWIGTTEPVEVDGLSCEEIAHIIIAMQGNATKDWEDAPNPTLKSADFKTLVANLVAHTNMHATNAVQLEIIDRLERTGNLPAVGNGFSGPPKTKVNFD